MTKTLFRCIVGGNIALLVASAAVLLLVDKVLPPELRGWVEVQSNSEWAVLDTFVVGMAVISVVASVGLLFFARWSRPVYAASSVAVIATGLFTGPLVSTAIEASLSDAILLYDGVVIGVAYFSDVRRCFERGRT
jgi:uncharacterized membrane protein